MNKKDIAKLKRALKRVGIRHDDVAAEAGVHRTMVVHVLAGRVKSSPVTGTALAMLSKWEAANARRPQS